MQLGDDALPLLCVDDVFHLCILPDVLEAEPGLEDLQVREDHGRAEVEEGPELLEAVLDGGARQQQARDGRHSLELADEAAVAVLDAVALVQDQILPRVSLQVSAVEDADLEAGEHDREGEALLLADRHLGVAQLGPLVLGAVVDEHGTVGQPLAEFVEPVRDGGERTSCGSEK